MGVHAAARLTGNVRELVRQELASYSPSPPDELFHYTTPDGLLGIFQSTSLFLSDARFVNDRSEISFGRRVFTERLRHFVESGGHPKAAAVWEHFARNEQRRGGEPHRFHGHFYLTSFCKDGNLLSQWRAYGAGGGCSLGFRSAELISGAAIVGDDAVSSTGAPVWLQEVLYDEARQHAVIDRILSAVFPLLDVPTANISEPIYLANTLDFEVIPIVAACIKSPVFREEQEWRLVCGSSSRTGLQFRLQRGKISASGLHCQYGVQEDHDQSPPDGGSSVPSRSSDSSRDCGCPGRGRADN